jgi:hypothetical protein
MRTSSMLIKPLLNANIRKELHLADDPEASSNCTIEGLTATVP